MAWSEPIHMFFEPLVGMRKRPGRRLNFFQAATIARFGGAGWSSPVARQAHNLKVAGSNPAPATNKTRPRLRQEAGFLFVRGTACVAAGSRAPA